MKKYILLLLLIAFLTPCKAQPETVPSSCIAPDSIVNLYRTDADRLTIRRVYRNNSSYKDSIHLPTSWRENSLRSLLAVYNAYSLPARDTIFSILNMHTLPNFGVELITIRSDSNLMWAKQLCDWGSPSGNYAVDSFITRYHLKYDRCYYNILFPSMYIDFVTDSNYNMYALGKAFSLIPGVYYYGQNYFTFDGPDITDSAYANFTELVFAYKWDDCFNGCIKKRYWKFHVYPDCSVVYLGSYGNQLTGEILSVWHVAPNQIKCYPNPFANTISIEGAPGKFHYRISDFTGKLCLEGIAKDVIEVNSNLPSGMYFISIQTDEGISLLKLVRQ